ncbi:pseudaminic acid synthase, partial [Enterococcus hirae]
EELNCPAYKIASFENNHLALIRKVSQTGKPVFISTGLADVATIKDAVATARDAGCTNLVLFKCTSSYPAEPINSNLATIGNMRDLFD